jgi:periplasmic protein TonB
MNAAIYRDDPWRRLPWSLPLALLLSALSLAAFLWFLSGSRYTPPPPPAVQVDVVELPAPPPQTESLPPLPLAPEPPPPPVVEPEPEPPPPPEQAIEPTPEAPPPPPPKPAPRPKVQATKPPPTAVPPPQTAVAPPPPPSAAPAGANTMGPRALYQPKPEIPEELRHHRLELVAIARFQVAANGATQVELIEPTPEPILNRALLETLKKWRFFPALQSGNPVASTIDMRIPVTVE